GAGVFVLRAVGRAARLPRAHGARASLRRHATRRGRAAARGAGVAAMIFEHTGVVIAGLDPAIHRSSQILLTKKMDARGVSAFTRVFNALLPAHDSLAPAGGRPVLSARREAR